MQCEKLFLTSFIDNPIYNKYFKHKHLLSGKVFDSPASQLFRLEHSTGQLLPQLGSYSRSFFLRRSGTVEANVIQLEGAGGGAEVRGIMSVSGGRANGRIRIGRALTATRERFLKERLNTLNRVLQLFKK